MSDLTVTIFFEWRQGSADPRQFNQQRTLLSPVTVVVAVDIPLKHEYIWNAEPIIQAQLSGGTTLTPILTPLGMVYADNVLRAAYSTLEENEGKVGEYVDTEIDWEDEDELVIEKLKDDSEFPVEELIDDNEEDELDEILWEN